MVAREIKMLKQHETMTQVRDVIERRAAEETVQQLRVLTPGGMVPNSAKSPDEVIMYLAEAILALDRRIDELERGIKSSADKPRPRGRPPRARAREQEAS